MTALAPRTGLPGTPHDTGITLPPDLTFEEWQDGLHLAERIERASPWWVVDLMAYGRERFGEEHSQALPTAEEDPSGVRQAKLKQAAWMADKFPADTRVPELTYTHHRAVAELDADDRQSLLREAATLGLSTRALIVRVQERQAVVNAPVVAGASEPVCAADGAWNPTADDLSDEAAARLRFEIGQRRIRHAEDFGAGWVAALAWVEALDCFKRD